MYGSLIEGMTGSMLGSMIGQGGGADASILKGLFASSKIAGRDGSTVTTRATQRTCVITGALLGNNVPCVYNLPIPGVGSIPMYGAWGTRQNIVPDGRPGNGNGMQGNAPGSSWGAVPSKVFTLTNTLVAHFTFPNASLGTLAGSTTFVESIYVKNISVANGVLVWEGQGADRTANNHITITNGVITGGTGVLYPMAGGGFRVSRVFTTIATPTGALNSAIYAGMIGPYQGIGGERFEAGGWQIEQATIPNPYIPTAGSAVTHNADQIVWTPPSPLSATSGEVVAIEAPYMWSAGAGVAHPSGVLGRLWDSNGNDYASRDTADGVSRTDVATQGASIPALADASAAIRMLSSQWDGAGLRIYRGGSLGATDSTLSPPWISPATLTTGNRLAGLDRAWSGMVGLLYKPGGLTGSERAALARALAGRQVAYGA